MSVLQGSPNSQQPGYRAVPLPLLVHRFLTHLIGESRALTLQLKTLGQRKKCGHFCTPSMHVR